MSSDRKVSLLFASAAAGLFLCAGGLLYILLEDPRSIAESLAFVGTLPEAPWFAFAFVVTPVVAATCAAVLWRLPIGVSQVRTATLVLSAIVLIALCLLRAFAVAVVFGVPVIALALSLRRGGA